ncbi:hypothetical protein E2562_024594 [Oryza meyeriana var. granulata]|uniref:Uncharacterized protein n=1 Tax=Oryza meyeriana var. granulata TaxID=110450 RepID=A0A6G1DND1_9ORYZ|nr:hypothetical protein E2562_024594 [Oryza meyeriana var. granulata]
MKKAPEEEGRRDLAEWERRGRNLQWRGFWCVGDEQNWFSGHELPTPPDARTEAFSGEFSQLLLAYLYICLYYCR